MYDQLKPILEKELSAIKEGGFVERGMGNPFQAERRG